MSSTNASPNMRRNPAIALIFLVGVLAASAWCLSAVIGMRFATGEVYPPGSTQRTDPMGVKALFEAVDRLPDTTAERNFRALAKLQGAAGQTLVLADIHPIAFYRSSDMRVSDGKTIKGIDGDAVVRFAAGGGRVVLALAASRDLTSKVWKGFQDGMREREEERRKKEEANKDDTKKDDSGKDDAKKNDAKDKPATPEDKARKSPSARDDEDDDLPMPAKPAKSVKEALHLGISRDQLPPLAEGGHPLSTPEGIAVLDGSLPLWQSQTCLDLDPPAEDSDDEKDAKKEADDASKDEAPGPAANPWRVLATVDGKPVLAEKQFGAGSIVVATDSYFFSNQALLMHPVPEFLAWLMGNAQRVIFDETHLGTQEDPGIMALARRYRLHGFFVGGILLFALFVWQSSSSLVPSTDDAPSNGRAVAGQGAVAGLVSLLRRGVSRSRLLQACFDQWVRNHPHPSPALQARIEQARALLPPPGKRPSRGALVVLYQRLCETLNPGRR